MAVRKTIVDVSSGVICKWRVVWGERGRGMESCFGWSVGDAEDMAAAVVSGGGCAWDGGFDDADMMRGMSDVRRQKLYTSVHILQWCLPSVPGKLFVDSLQPYAPQNSVRAWF